MKKWLAGFALAGVACAAIAQVPGLFITSPSGTEQINVVNAGPQITSVYLRQIRDAEGYSKASPTSGTQTFAVGQSQMQIGGGTTISSLTIAFTASPVDGQLNCFYSKPAITTLTLSATSPQTINDAVTAASATTRYCYLYSASNSTWDRLQ